MLIRGAIEDLIEIQHLSKVFRCLAMALDACKIIVLKSCQLLRM